MTKRRCNSTFCRNIVDAYSSGTKSYKYGVDKQWPLQGRRSEQRTKQPDMKL